MLPSLDGARVVDLGCGFGAFCRWAAHRALRRCSAIDLSQRMLERAAADTANGSIRFDRQDLGALTLPVA